MALGFFGSHLLCLSAAHTNERERNDQRPTPHFPVFFLIKPSVWSYFPHRKMIDLTREVNIIKRLTPGVKTMHEIEKELQAYLFIHQAVNSEIR